MKLRKQGSRKSSHTAKVNSTALVIGIQLLTLGCTTTASLAQSAENNEGKQATNCGAILRSSSLPVASFNLAQLQGRHSLLRNSGLPTASFDQLELMNGKAMPINATAMSTPGSLLQSIIDKKTAVDVPNRDETADQSQGASKDGALTASPTASSATASADSAFKLDENGVIVIDNDEPAQLVETITYQELETDDAKTLVKIGARFPVMLSSEVSSRTAKKGDPIEARLLYDLKIGDRLVAKRGAIVSGHVNYCLSARTGAKSLVSSERLYRNSGCLGLAFDDITTDNGEHIPLVATPAQQALIIKNKADGRLLGVNKSGEITGPWSQQLKYKAIHIGVSAAAAPAGVFSFGAVPAALGVMGAINPSFAFCKPVGLNVRHRRVKGFAMGAISGLPGGFAVQELMIKGQEAIVKPGDELLAEFKQEFTGLPSTSANLMPGTSTKVHGEVVPSKEAID